MKVITKTPVNITTLKQGDVFKKDLNDKTIYIYLGERKKELQESGFRCNCASIDTGYLWTLEDGTPVFPIQGAFVEGAE